MQLLKSTQHPSLLNLGGTCLTRKATRGIVLDGENILLLYTERYHDYSLPGGGVDEGESLTDGLKRELQEETGAQNIEILAEFGLYEEYRPWYKKNFDIIHMLSYCYVCKINKTLAETAFESHEIQNGMEPVWVNIFEAISHNEETIKTSPKKGLSIERETFLLKKIAQELISNQLEISSTTID
ncbi:MAG: NUDIX hydrolase [Colwellia sp.]|nr:NUDIX hydrolase [Colwellia sp.]